MLCSRIPDEEDDLEAIISDTKEEEEEEEEGEGRRRRRKHWEDYVRAGDDVWSKIRYEKELLLLLKE